MSYTNINQFVGPINLVVLGDDAAQLEIQIGITEEKILRNALGDILYSVFLADLDGSGNPQTQKFIDLLDGVTTGSQTYLREDAIKWPDDWKADDQHTVIAAKSQGLIRFSGLKPAFPQFIWFDYSVSKSLRQTGSGGRSVDTENSTAASFGQNQALTVPNYSLGIKYYNEVLTWISNYLEVSETVTAVLDNADNTYTLSVDSTIYLSVGDVVLYDGEERTVTAVTAANWTADFGSVGLNLPLTESSWEPFEADDWNPAHLEDINHMGF